MKLLKNILSNNKNRKILIMPVGLSGSGKTKLYKELSKEFDIQLISFDRLRIDIFRKETGNTDYREAFRYISQKKIKLLPIAKDIFKRATKNIIYIDNTNLKKKSRNKFLCIADRFLKIAVFFEPDIKECIKRQLIKGRDKTVPPSVILQQMENLEPPDFDEFDIIIKKRLKNGKNSSDNWNFKRIR
ncbi:AAA family ATPase [Persephonella sp.]